MEVRYREDSNVTLKYSEGFNTGEKYGTNIIIYVLIYFLLIGVMTLGMPKVLSDVFPNNLNIQVVITISGFVVVTAVFYILTKSFLHSNKLAVAELIEYLTSCETIDAELYFDNRINFKMVRKTGTISMYLNNLMGQLKYKLDNQCINRHGAVNVEIDLTDVNNIVVRVRDRV